MRRRDCIYESGIGECLWSLGKSRRRSLGRVMGALCLGWALQACAVSDTRMPAEALVLPETTAAGSEADGSAGMRIGGSVSVGAVYLP
jgi:hypothetical protein